MGDMDDAGKGGIVETVLQGGIKGVPGAIGVSMAIRHRYYGSGLRDDPGKGALCQLAVLWMDIVVPGGAQEHFRRIAKDGLVGRAGMGERSSAVEKSQQLRREAQQGVSASVIGVQWRLWGHDHPSSGHRIAQIHTCWAYPMVQPWLGLCCRRSSIQAE